jgi:uncharacterized protein (TIGR03032 family)
MRNPTPASASAGEFAPAVIRVDLTGDFAGWIARAGGSVALTTYQAGKLVFVGWDGRQVSLMSRDFDRAMGLAVDGPRMLLATRHQIHLLVDSPVLAHDFLEGQPGRYDAIYLPRVTFHTGELNIHDVAFGEDGIWMVNTRFSCLARPDFGCSFVPRWQPPFVSATVPEDRCHLNGLYMADGRPKYVTALGETDDVGGWRDRKADGGVLIDVDSGEIVMRGLCMPHSPRMYGGALWVLNSGAGELWRIDPASFRHEVVCALPGYLRGLDFTGHFALVGLCMIREKHTFAGLPVQAKHPHLHCALAVIDLRSGIEVGRLEFTAGCTEIYDVRFLPSVHRPMILNADKEAARHAVTAPEFAYWLRPSSALPPIPGQ